MCASSYDLHNESQGSLTIRRLASVHDLLELSVNLTLVEDQVLLLLLSVEVHRFRLLADLLRVQ